MKSKRENDNFKLNERKPRKRKNIRLTLKTLCQFNQTKLFTFVESEIDTTNSQKKLIKKSKLK